MKAYHLSLPLIALISSTRALAGSGLALLLADKMNEHQRQAIGWTLFGIGALATIPIAAMLCSCRQHKRFPYLP